MIFARRDHHDSVGKNISLLRALLQILALFKNSVAHIRTNAEPNNIRGFEPHTAHGGQGPKSGGYDPNMFFSVSEAFCEEIDASHSVPESSAASRNRSTKRALFGSDLVPGVLVPGLQPLGPKNYAIGQRDIGKWPYTAIFAMVSPYTSRTWRESECGRVLSVPRGTHTCPSMIYATITT